MVTNIVVGVDKLEEWLWNIGCKKGPCPNAFICIWYAPGRLGPFSAPNPAKYSFVPLKQMSMLADIIAEIMKALGSGIGFP